MEEVLNIDTILHDLTLRDYIDGLRGISPNRRVEIEKKYENILDKSITIDTERVE
jgi:5'-3' exonuclease